MGRLISGFTMFYCVCLGLLNLWVMFKWSLSFVEPVHGCVYSAMVNSHVIVLFEEIIECQ